MNQNRPHELHTHELHTETKKSLCAAGKSYQYLILKNKKNMYHINLS